MLEPLCFGVLSVYFSLLLLCVQTFRIVSKHNRTNSTVLIRLAILPILSALHPRVSVVAACAHRAIRLATASLSLRCLRIPARCPPSPRLASSVQPSSSVSDLSRWVRLASKYHILHSLDHHIQLVDYVRSSTTSALVGETRATRDTIRRSCRSHMRSACGLPASDIGLRPSSSASRA